MPTKSKRILIFGGAGFLGRTIVARLAKDGHEILIGTRTPNYHLRLQQLGDIGQIALVRTNPLDPESYRPLLSGVGAVINLIGTFAHSRKLPMAEVHANSAGRLARHLTDRGIENLVHFSAFGASLSARSLYGKTKYMGENAVRELLPTATILRPSVVFGAEDQFYNRFARMANISPVVAVPRLERGLLYPVHVGDVAEVVARVIAERRAGGFDLLGPVATTLEQVVRDVVRWTGHKRILVPVEKSALELAAYFMQLMPNPMLTVDQLRTLEESSSAPPCGDFARFAISPQYPADIVPEYLRMYRCAN